MDGFGREEMESDRYPAYWPGIAAVAGIALLLHLLAAGNYGYFRDELYYLACAQNPSWGYVDHPPLAVFILRTVTGIFGDSLFAVRLSGFLAHIGIVALYGLIAREYGADERGQILSACFGAFSPVILVVTHLYSMNGLDVLLSAWAVLAWLRARKEESLFKWIIFGVIAGLAVLNKLSALLLIGGIGIAMLTTHRRRELKSWQPWAGLAVAAVVASPYLLWLADHDYATFEFIRNATTEKMLPVPPGQFLLTQFLVTNPLLFILALGGLWFGWYRRPFRPSALAFTVVVLVLIISQKSRENYLAPAFAFVAPLGALRLSEWLAEKPVLKNAYRGLLAASTVVLAVLALPFLPPQNFINLTGGAAENLPAAERGKKSPLQGHADMFGWPEMAAAAREVWLSLPEAERARTPVFGVNYGQSSAVWFFNKDNQSAPKVIGRHNNWWLWGPGDWDGQTLIIVGDPPDAFKTQFATYKTVRTLDHPYAVPEEATAPVSVARGLKVPVQDFWAQIKHFQ